MAEYGPAFAKVIELEGGFVDHPDDPGGATNFGISLRFLQTQEDYELGDIDNDGDLDYDDIKNMKLSDASALYKKHWWDKYGYGSIPNQAIANKLFDMAVNMGAKQAHKLLQRAINCVVGQRLLVDDGILGEKSSQGMGAAIQQPLALLAALRAQQEGFYRALVAGNDKFSVFLKGWLNRAIS
jgi:lysozyme family protein